MPSAAAAAETVGRVLSPWVARARRALDGRPPEANILFLHMPKCAGQSINAAIARHYAGRRPVFRLPIRPAARAAELAGRETMDLCHDLLLFQLAQRRYGYISGHFPFSLTAWTEFRDDWKFVTVLRHPVQRWFSHYFYNRFKTHSELDRITDEIESFIETERAARYGRIYVRHLSESGDVNEALANLRKFDLVGQLERLPDFAERFQRMFGIPLSIGRRNENPLVADRQQAMITPEIQTRVEKLCALDTQVYDYALRLTRQVAEPQAAMS